MEDTPYYQIRSFDDKGDSQMIDEFHWDKEAKEDNATNDTSKMNFI